ncbi:MAG: hypothetical protein ABI600_05235 [Luteolibacter sp.]
MKPSSINPNDHTPEVSPGDDWDDADGFAQDDAVSAAVLPPRRVALDRAGFAPVENFPSGLRLEPNVARREASDDRVKLDVQEISSSVFRLEQPSPSWSLKAVTPVVFQEKGSLKANSKDSRSEDHDWGIAHKFSLKWIFGITFGGAAVIILCLVLLPLINRSNAVRTTNTERDLTVIEEEKVEGIDALNTLLTMQPEAERIFSAYASAAVVDDVIGLLRNPAAVEKTVRKTWRSLGVPHDWVPPQETAWQVLKANKIAYGLLDGRLPGFSKFSAYFVKRGSDLQLDWKASTGFGTAAFNELSKNQGDASEIRGLISRSSFYTAVWPEEEYQCYQLLAPVGETSIWCYARRTEAAGNACASLFQNGEILEENNNSQKVTVRLEHGPDGTLPNQWLIGELLQSDWVTP